MSPPAPAPDHRPHLDLRTAVIAVLIGALTLGGVVGGGLLAAGDTNYAQPPTTDRTRSPTPSDSWASGSTQQWSTAIDPGASIFTSPDHLFSVKTDGENTQSSTLTAYTMDDSGPSAAWTATVDTTGDSVATNGAKNNPTIYPAFLTWGKNTLIHGTTLYDITTGDTTDAPWPTDAVPVVAGDTVIACQKTTCAGYREGDTTPAWSSAVNDPVKGLPANSETDIAAGIINDAHNYAIVYTRGDARYAIIAHHYVFNIDTGEFINFSVPEENPAVYAVTSTTEGWAISSAHFDVLSGTSKEWHMSFYDIDGGKPKSTETQRPLDVIGVVRHANLQFVIDSAGNAALLLRPQSLKQGIPVHHGVTSKTFLHYIGFWGKVKESLINNKIPLRPEGDFLMRQTPQCVTRVS